MAGRHEGRGYAKYPYSASSNAPFPRYPEPESQDILRNNTPSGARFRGHSPGYGKPSSYTQQSNRPHPFDGTSSATYDEDETEDESNDNPLYELEDSRPPMPAPQGVPNNNPLYGNDPFKPMPSETVCMTEFLRPKGPRYQLRPSPKKPRKVNRYRHTGQSDTVNSDFDGFAEGSPSPPRQREMYELRSRSANAREKPLRQDPYDSGNHTTIKSYPPARFSPIPPPQDSFSHRAMSSTDDSGPLVYNPKSSSGKRAKQTLGKTSRDGSPSGEQRKPQPRFALQSVKDLVAAVRSDQNLLKAEVRKDGAREPRIPGDHDRYFGPRKGDIIVHFTPTLDHNKLVEYFDEKTTMQRIQPGDKLVRVKYDNYKIPDHLMITSKLYIYVPEWVYLGKAVQTIKTA